MRLHPHVSYLSNIRLTECYQVVKGLPELLRKFVLRVLPQMQPAQLHYDRQCVNLYYNNLEGDTPPPTHSHPRVGADLRAIYPHTSTRM